MKGFPRTQTAVKRLFEEVFGLMKRQRSESEHPARGGVNFGASFRQRRSGSLARATSLFLGVVEVSTPVIYACDT